MGRETRWSDHTVRFIVRDGLEILEVPLALLGVLSAMEVIRTYTDRRLEIGTIRQTARGLRDQANSLITTVLPQEPICKMLAHMPELNRDKCKTILEMSDPWFVIHPRKSRLETV